MEHQFVTEPDGVCETLSVGASVALDDNAIQSQKYTSIGRFQLFLRVFVPFAFTRSPNPASWEPQMQYGSPRRCTRADEEI